MSTATEAETGVFMQSIHYNRIAIFFRRIRHGIYWRMLKMRPYWARLCIAWRWCATSAGRCHPLPGELVVSLTSYPPRFCTLALTLRSLLRQTVRADRIILWIAPADMPHLPNNVLDLKNSGLEIRATDDIQSYKKIIPALALFPDAFICTADDDIYYPASWLEQLMDGVSKDDRVVTCHRAHEITFDSQGRFEPYDQWSFDTPRRGKSSGFLPTSGAGALYPPGAFSPEVLNREALLALCPRADDIWLYWMGRMVGATYRTIGQRRDIINWAGSQNVSLYNHNVIEGGNDEQIRKVAERYGYPAANCY
jgi:hypothetical protein